MENSLENFSSNYWDDSTKTVLLQEKAIIFAMNLSDFDRAKMKEI